MDYSNLLSELWREEKTRMVQGLQKQKELTAKNYGDRDRVASNDFFAQYPISYATIAFLIILYRPPGLFLWQIPMLYSEEENWQESICVSDKKY